MARLIVKSPYTYIKCGGGNAAGGYMRYIAIRAVENLEQLAELGDPHAQFLMGRLCRDGPLLIPDSQTARRWFTHAANTGLPQAQYALGKLLLSDDPESRDPDEGLCWLKQAAQGGSHYAAYRLGKEYLTGEVIQKDAAKAVEWFAQSAAAGNQYAQYMLGKLYLMGLGVSCDRGQAIHWLTQSANQGNRYAQFFLDRQDELRPPSVMLSVTRLLHHMGNIFRDNSLPRSNAGLTHANQKLRQKMRDKRIAMGHKTDDHEELQYGGWNMTMD